ncbi:MAG: DUF423 domain-containing protein [Bacteroidia bacterium]|jgi:uncharacterized membrane protein YgdD (TMEM256/DUF423 family)|nr:DUF423 domain-containing protein [Bacteroidia bacterium]
MTNATLQKQIFQAACAFIGLGMIAGAFGSHLLKGHIKDSEMLGFETAVRYQLFNGIGLLIIAIGIRRIKEDVAKVVFALIVIGILLFSGSLYLLTTSIIWANVRLKWLGIITPFGGLSLISAWLYLAYKGFKPSSNGSSGDKIMKMQRRTQPSDEE